MPFPMPHAQTDRNMGLPPCPVLTVASEVGNLEAVKLLLEHGATVQSATLDIDMQARLRVHPGAASALRILCSDLFLV
jgi:hypothetical protein